MDRFLNSVGLNAILRNAEDGAGGGAASVNDTGAGAASGADTQVDVSTGADAGGKAAEVVVNHEAALDDDLMKVWSKNHPDRGEGGQFTGKDTNSAEAGAEDAAAAAAAGKTGEKENADHPAEEGTGPAKEQATDAPNSWSAEEKAVWAKVPPEARTIIARRETEMHRAITRAGEERKTFEPHRQTLERNADLLEYGAQTHNWKPHEVVSKLFDMERFLRSNPQAAIQSIAKAYKVNLSQGAGDANAEPENVDPKVVALEGEVAQLKSFLTSQQRQAHERNRDGMARTIAEFAKDKPHYTEVEGLIAQLLPGIIEENPGKSPAETLGLAYEQAIYAHPKIRPLVIDDQRKAEQKAREDNDRKRADEARKAGAVNVKGGPGASSSPRSLDDDLGDIARKHYGNAAA